MKNTSQIIGACALLTFAVSTTPPQQMFALPYADHESLSNSSNENEQWKSIIITEIMADPSPPQSLPEVEYVELFNRTSAAIDLAGWHLSDASRSAALPAVLLQPRQYVVMTSKSTEFTIPNVRIVTNLPSLNNTGDLLTLSDPAGNAVDILNYSDAWYRDSQRKNGGWSLELIDPDNICEEANNWNVTEDRRGGTPGEQNSIFASNPDTTGPYLLSVQPLDKLVLRLVFNEKLAADVLTSAKCLVTPSLDVRSSSFGDSARSVIDLHLINPMMTGVLYSITLQSVFDCAGNLLQGSQGHFALPERAERGDIVINEVLFNPYPNAFDFVELFNLSGKYIDLNGWAIGSLNEDGNLQKVRIAQTIILPPDGYIAFSADLMNLKSHYDAPDSTLAGLKLPPYPDDDGTIIVLNDIDSVMDRFAYAADMHNVFLRDDEGVSLERISASEASDQRSNWTSASSLAGFGTPGRQNSTARSASLREASPVRVIPKAFTPMVGQPNAAEISYRFDQPGYVATVNICDNRGVVIRRLINNELLATEGILRWEGDRDDGRKAQTGYYMVWFQVFASNGSARLYRVPVAVSSKY